MTLLAPWSALLAAAVGVPALVLLYMLKLRRRRAAVPSTMLWQQTFRDLEANVPFQRMRFTALFVLQLLAILLTALAIGRPAIESADTPGQRAIILIDRSASMQAGPAPTRFDQAREAAGALADRLMGSGRTAVMVVGFASSANVATPLSRDRRAVAEAIAALEPTDEEANLAEALRVADAFSMQGESLEDEPPDVYVLSDGGVRADARQTVRARRVEFVRIGGDPGDAVNNVGIVSFGAQRGYEDPAIVDLFARLANAGPEPVDLVASLLADGITVRTWPLTVPPADEAGPGETTLTHRVEAPWSTLLLFRHNHDDQLAADDAAAVVLAPPQAARIGIVSADGDADAFLVDLLALTEPAALRELSLASYEDGALDEELDLLIFDRVAPASWPAVPSLTIGAAPADVILRSAPDERGRRILSWNRRHPLTRHVALDGLVYAGTGGFELPSGADALATGPDGPVIATIAAGGARHAMVAFALRDSNWPVDPSFAVFVQNTLDVLAFAGTAARSGVASRPGDALTVRPIAGRDELRIEGPRAIDVPVAERTVVTLPALPKAGVYAVDGARPPDDVIALSVLSDIETDLRPREDLPVGTGRIGAITLERTAPREIWPWIVAACLVLLTAEWGLYVLYRS